jgi:cyclohexanecarboxylate-CoA ligase
MEGIRVIQGPATIHAILKKSSFTFGQKTAFTDGERTISFNTAMKWSVRLAKHFVKLGLKKGDVLAVQLPNSLEFVLAHVAASHIGLIFNPLSPNYRKKELLYMLGHCETKALITTERYKHYNLKELAYEVKTRLPHLEHIIVTGQSEQAEGISFFSLLEEDPYDIRDSDLKKHEPEADDPCLIMFTSGTESNPKAVLHTNRTFVSTHLMNGPEYGITNKDTILSLTPLAHMFSLPMIMLSLQAGAKHYLYSEYDVKKLADILQKEKVTFLIAAPAHLIDILHHFDKKEADETSIRFVLTGGSKIPSQMVKKLIHVLGCRVGAQWGMTEVGAGTFTRPGDDPEKAWKTVGRPCPAGEVIIVDEDHRSLPTGAAGEIAFKGCSVFIEYYRNREETKAAFTEEDYFLTGDQGYLDEEGYLHFTGRTKDTINRGGLKFHASEIEEALQMHPKIRQVAIVSVPDFRLGERACAFVALRENQHLDFEEMKSFLLQKGFAKYKIPEYCEIRNELPTTPSGKIFKEPLRKEAKLLGQSKM